MNKSRRAKHEEPRTEMPWFKAKRIRNRARNKAAKLSRKRNRK